MTLPPPATLPTIYFIGVTTARSSIMRVFPLWAEALALGPCRIVGIDLPLHAPPARYREVVGFIAGDPLSRGALVTTHKIDLYAACRDRFDETDPLAALMGEVSCLAKRGGRLAASAKDPITAGLALDEFLPAGHFAGTGAELFVIGAGGSAIAITWHLMRPERGGDRPARVVVSNRSRPRLDSLAGIHRQMGFGVPVAYVDAPAPADNDAVLAALPAGSLVVNATGLGKDAPGSPLSHAAVFPERGIAWDLNYRGELVFLDQARAQAAARGLTVVDGWRYFIHGWARAIAEVFAIDLPLRGPAVDRLSAIAASTR